MDDLAATIKDLWAALRPMVPTSTRRQLEERHPWLRETHPNPPATEG